MRRMIGLHAADPPARIRPAGDRTRRRNRGVERVALAQVASQQRIDERLDAGVCERRRRIHRAIDDGKRRRPGVVELIQGHRDERRERWRGLALRERLHERREAAPMAQRTAREFADEGGVAGRAGRRDVSERHRQGAALHDPAHDQRSGALLLLHRSTRACRSDGPGSLRARWRRRRRPFACRRPAAR